ncbi:GNAT family N-acetyltransferase [Nonomuraea typhae]|uniref:GNAT family N-acetyltransferase n=1 Tax=Nonomuraea typhae TaxID=2603600 RepID=UPI0012F8CA32|nr:GNAT family N-acetyltransferase [Nonomuraea typhae]
MRHWPLFRLSVTTPRLQLRLPTLPELDELGDRAAEGVHEEGFMPFMVPWTATSPEQRARNTVAYHFKCWGESTAENWTASFVVVYNGMVIGTQELAARDFAVRREVVTGSWLGRRFQGKGFGTEMRRAVLHLAFEGLGAHWAVTSAFEDNRSSLGVTRKLGYREDGRDLSNREGKPVFTLRFRMSRENFKPEDGYAISGLEPCLPHLGAR